MMKTFYSTIKRASFLLLALVVGGSNSNKASAQVIAEGFDNILTLPASGWTMQNLSSPLGLTNWFQGNDLVMLAYTGNNDSYIGANFNNTSGTGTISNWLITPNRTFNNGDQISFFTAKADPDIYPDRMQVRLSTNGTSTNVGATSTSVGDFTTLLLDINPTLDTGIYPTTWTQYTITLSGLPGPTSGRIAFRYFVTSGGPDGDNSDYIGIDEFFYSPFCSLTMPVGAIAENETCSADSNGGCNSVPPVYMNIDCGVPVAATSWWDGANRDTDWYRFTVTSATTVTLTVSAEFPFDAFLINDVCPVTAGDIIGPGASGNPCQVINYAQPLAAGNYVAFVAPRFDTPVFSCADNPRRNYYISVNMPATTPTITPSGATSFCPGGNVTLTSSSALSYLWSTGDTTQSINVTTSGNYTVTTTSGPNSCAVSSVATVVTVYAPPVVSITGVNYTCTGGSSILTASAAAGSGIITGYQWQESNVDILGETDSTYTASAAGTYTVIVTNSNGCSTTSAPVTFTIANNPTVNITGAVTVCEGDSVPLIANATAGSGTITGYQWQESNVDISGATDSAYDATASGSYTVIVTNSFGCTAASAPVSVTVNAAPVVSITGVSAICSGNMTTLTANAVPGSGSITGYQWQESNVDIPGETDSTYDAITIGTYTVIVTNSNGCSTTSAAFTVTVATSPTVSITGNTGVCAGSVLTSTAIAGSGIITGYQWQESNVNISGATDSTYNATVSGSYTVIVTNSFGCTATSAPLSIIIYAAPTVSVSGINFACAGNGATLTANATAGSGFITGYQWQENNVDIPGDTNSTYTATTAGSYSVIVTNSNGCSTTSIPFTFTIANLPTANITGNMGLCAGDSTLLSANATAGSGSISNYQWQQSNIDIAGANDSSYYATSVGSYTVIVTNTFGCTASSAPVSVTLLPLAIAGYTYTTVGDSVSFTNTSTNATSYSWDFGDASPLDTNANPSHIYPIDGSYIVTLTVTNSCGTNTFTDTIVIITSGISIINNSNEFSIYPNPVSNQLNIQFNSSFSEDFVLTVFNSLGQVKYSQTVSKATGDTYLVVDVSEFARGCYTLQLTGSHSIFRSKFIVE
jgi:PKD repeat protein